MPAGTRFKLVVLLIVSVAVCLLFITTRENLPKIPECPSTYESPLTDLAVQPSKPPESPTYLDADPTLGSDPKEDKKARLLFHFATQQAVCVNIVTVGGRAVTKGRDPDGAWRVCYDEGALQVNPSSCIVYSFGINRDWSFDEGMERKGCHVFSFDPSMGMDDHKHSANITFYNMGLSDSNANPDPAIKDNTDKKGWKMRTLDSIIQYLGHSNKMIDVLKMDIELDEWKSLTQILSTGVLKKQVKQLCVEFHLKDQSPNGLKMYYSIAKLLEKEGFLLFHRHLNSECKHCLEVAYVNINLVKLPVRN